MYIRRTIEKFLEIALKQFPACLITGPRQAGKSTLLKNCLPKYRYISLDDPLTANLAKNDPKLFLSTYSAPIIIDEVQYAPELLRYLKILIDNNRHNYGQYVLTGSQIFSLMDGVTESLAGRIAIFNLYPLNWEEIKPILTSSIYNDRFLAGQLVKGFYPEFFRNPELDKQLWFGSYFATYIERDVRNVKAITDISRFQTFIGLLSTRVGQLLNLSEIAKECSITQPTAKNWLSILESTYLIYLLKPYHNNLSKRLIKSPKLYFVDTGLLCYIMGITDEEQLLRSPQRGSIFENMIVMECKKQLCLKKSSSKLYFYRSTNRVEVDLIIKDGNDLEAFEIKFAKTLSKDMTKSLSIFKKDHPKSSTKIISLNEENIPITKDIEAVHWSNLF